MRLGSFELVAPIASGGMGAVWHAKHIGQGLEVAVKVLSSDRASQREYHQRFANEVRSIASVSHPGIVMVFDYGWIPGSVAAKSEGQLVRDSPYLAMALAPHGTLRGLEPCADFSAARNLLMQVLDALAHAHARGIIHRDLKPGNILVAERKGKTVRLELSDFGLAHSLTDLDTDELEVTAVSGTPEYMAPEQILGNRRDQGPWTDLYAVGCIAHTMFYGATPYQGSTESVFRQHLHAPVVQRVPRFPLPDDAHAWLMRLLAKSHRARYQYAADAAEALDDLRGCRRLVPPAPEPAGDRAPAQQQSTEATRALSALAASFDDKQLALVDPTVAPAPATPPAADAWRCAPPPPLPMQMVGTGLSLYGVRPIPIVDRDRERQALWDRLLAVTERGAIEVAILRGHAGTGKSRLARWLCETAHELGAARVLRATHGTRGGPTAGLGRMVAEHTRCVGLGRDDVRARLGRTLGHEISSYDIAVLGDLIAGSSEQRDITAQRPKNEEWFAALARLLAVIARERPVILWLDDVQWGADALAFLSHLTASESPTTSILAVATVREDALRERPLESRRLAALLERNVASVHHVAALESSDHVALVGELLRLHPALATAVAERTAGNPLFAVQLVGDWVERGVLEVAGEGFQLVEGETATLPDDIFAVWSSRFDRFLGGCEDGQSAELAVEVAAALGDDFDAREWYAACRHAGVSATANTLEALALAGLAVVRADEWSFCHGMLRETVEMRTRARARWEVHNEACAQMLRELYEGRQYPHAERLARHYVEANHAERALTPLLDAAEHYARLGDYDRVEDIFSRRDRLLDELGIPDRDAHRVRGWIHHGRNLLFQGNLERVEALLADAEAAIANLDDTHLRGHALWLRSRLERHRRRPVEALPHARAALQCLRSSGDELAAGNVERGLGELHRILGHLDDSRRYYEQARSTFEKLGDRFQMAWCSFGMAAVCKQADDLDAAAAHIGTAIDHFESAQGLWAIAPALNERGDIARVRGDLAAAEENYRRALELLPPNHADRGVIELNRALLAISARSFETAAQRLETARDLLESAGHQWAFVYIDAGRLACASHAGDWTLWDRLYTSGRDALRGGIRDRDLAACLTIAADECAGAGEDSRAADLRALAALSEQVPVDLE